jgi:hypothetical protein
MLREITRRHFFQQTGFGIGYAALRSLLDQSPPSPLRGFGETSFAWLA